MGLSRAEKTETHDRIVRMAARSAHLPRKRRAFAREALATMIGAVSMARAVDDDALANENLKTAAVALEARLSEGRDPR